jgi:selenocysteine lyase/cysteine desulfurase
VSTLNWDEVRQQFPALEEKTFLDAACVSLAPRRAVEAIQKFLDSALYCPERSSTEHHIVMDELRAQLRPLAARLINADETDVAIVESTTQGLSFAASAIPLEAGDRVLLCDLEFLQLAVPWCQMKDQRGLEIDVVPNRNGIILVDDIRERITSRTKVLAVSSVQWSNGFKCDLDALSALCREKDIWLVVDAVQQLGAFPIDVRQTPVDVLVAGGHKWLNSPFGTGFLYLRRERVSSLRAPLAGYLSVEPPEGGWGHYFQTPTIAPVRDYRFVDEARRFEIGGTANYPGAIGLAASLELVHEIGQERIAARIAELTDHLIGGLEKRGLDVVTPTDPEDRSGIVTFSVGSSEQNVATMERLLDHGVLVSVRYTSGVGGVRVSCHYYNFPDDLDRLLELL